MEAPLFSTGERGKQSKDSKFNEICKKNNYELEKGKKNRDIQ